jgi:hypothetical protein
MNRKATIAIVAGLGAAGALMLFCCCGVGGFTEWLWESALWQPGVQPIVAKRISESWFR